MRDFMVDIADRVLKDLGIDGPRFSELSNPKYS
jgi:hypothetical protein